MTTMLSSWSSAQYGDKICPETLTLKSGETKMLLPCGNKCKRFSSALEFLQFRVVYACVCGNT